MTLPNGTVANYTYDAASQLTSLVHEKILSTGKVVSFDYDIRSNLILARDTDSELTFEYDAPGRATRGKQRPLPPSPPPRSAPLFLAWRT